MLPSSSSTAGLSDPKLPNRSNFNVVPPKIENLIQSFLSRNGFTFRGLMQSSISLKKSSPSLENAVQGGLSAPQFRLGWMNQCTLVEEARFSILGQKQGTIEINELRTLCDQKGRRHG